MRTRSSISNFAKNSKVLLNADQKASLKGGMKRFEELRSAGGSAHLYDADSETFDR